MRSVLGIVACLLLDQSSKFWALSSLSMHEARPVISPLLDLVLVKNFGAAYGIFTGQKWFLVAISLAVIIGALIWRNWFNGHLWRKLAFVFLLSGATGNLLDRLFRGYVVDFIDIHFIPVFNVADILINLAVYCLIWDSLYHDVIKPRQKI